VLDGGAGSDIMTGYDGNDTYYIDNIGDQVIEAAGQGNDTVISTIALTTEIANVENYTFTTSTALNFTADAGSNVIAGGSGNDTIQGNGGTDRLYGGAGNDILIAGSGADTLNGGLGADKMTGGAGDDTYDVDNIGDQVIELIGGGIDLVYTSVSISKLWDNVENVAVKMFGNQNVTGNDLDNEITGGIDNNILNGGLGNDVLDGNGGKDTLTGGAGNDVFDFYLGGGPQDHATITDFNKTQDSLSFSGVSDLDHDNALTLADLNQSVASIVDGGMGKNVDVTFLN